MDSRDRERRVGASGGDAPATAPDLAAILDRARRQLFPEAPILIELSPSSAPAPLEAAAESELSLPHRTTSGNAANPVLLAEALGVRNTSLVHLVEKTPRNPFAGMVTVGRAANNDIVVPHTSVSKFHAYFRSVRDDLLVHDVGSTNGTQVDRRRLKLEGVILSAFARVEFGHRAFLYVARPDVRGWLRDHLAATSAKN